MTNVDLAEVMALERALQTAAVRSDPARLAELMAPDFEEIGASGRMWDLPSILEMLSTEDDETPEIEVHELTGHELSDGVVLLRWQSLRDGRRVHRTSLWQRREVGWRLVHHQGTPAASQDS